MRNLPTCCCLLLAGWTSGCASLPDADSRSDGLLASTGDWLNRSGQALAERGRRLTGTDAVDEATEDERREAVEALFAQPYIDPLTEFLEAHGDDVSYAPHLVRVAEERERRCAAIADDYRERSPDRETLARYRAGYLYSCPADVNAFHARVREAEQVTDAQADDGQADEEAASAASGSSGDVEQAVDRRAANDCYLYFTIRDLTRAAESCAGPARAGDAKAQHHLASLARLDGDSEAAQQWARRSADQAHPDGMRLLGELYAAGEGVTRDPSRAYAWLRRAADAGDEAAAARAEEIGAGLSDEAREAAEGRRGDDPQGEAR